MRTAKELLTEPLKLEQGRTERLEVTVPCTQEALSLVLREKGLGEAVLVIWQLNAIHWGIVRAGELTLADGASIEPEFWQELRVFTDSAELFLRRAGDRLTGRLLRETESGEASQYVDTLARFWGAATERQEGWLTLVDSERKLRMVLPAPEGNSKYYGLVTRNYVAANEKTAQAGYVDYRYVAIAAADL